MNFEIKHFFFGWFLTNGVKVILIIVGALAINTCINSFFKKILKISPKDIEQNKSLQTIYSIFKSVLNWVVMIVAGMLVLQEFNVNIGPILAAAGVLGIAVGFGSQRLIEDIISGILILMNRQLRVGDVVKINGTQGYVEKIALHLVVLRDLSGNVHFMRNGKIDSITNMTKDYSYFLTDIGISYNEDVERVMQVIEEVGRELQSDEKLSQYILAPLEIFGIDKFGESAVILQCRVKTTPVKQWEIGREFNLMLKKAFDKYGIEFPYPQTSVHIEK